MYRLIEASEKIELSLPLIGANIISTLIASNRAMTVYKLLEEVSKTHQNYGDNRIMQSLIFLYAVGAIELDGIHIEVVNDNS
jgi:hypothetical protein